MLDVRPAAARGVTRLDWLDSRHSFSFAGYHDPAHMGYRSLRVINEDIIAPGAGFDTHGHRDMEILTHVLDGRLAHKDSTGEGAVIGPGDIQIMSAGKGIRHSEFNPDPGQPVHLLQIWLLPGQKGLPPGYRQKHFDFRDDSLTLIANPEGDNGALQIHQDARIYVGRQRKGHALGYELAHGRHAWLQLAKGALDVNGATLDAGDGIAVSGDTTLDIQARAAAEFVLFDLG